MEQPRRRGYTAGVAISKSEPRLPAVPILPIPKRIARYEVIDRLATGGMAEGAQELPDPSGQPLALVHRDISPHNLMVTAEGHTKLLEIGGGTVEAHQKNIARDLSKGGFPWG